MAQSDDPYSRILIEAIRVCADYKPKMGQGGKVGLDLKSFQTLYRADPFYGWFGLDNPLMYAAHKAAGGMTSVYRQIGIGCERLVRQLLQDCLGLTEDDANWSYVTTGANNKTRRLSLDGRIPLEKLDRKEDRRRVRTWIQKACRELDVDRSMVKSLKGVVFEIRQGYKSKDAKRQNADIANAATAYTQAYLPCVLVLSTQIDADIATRYRQEKWALLVGTLGDDSGSSTYAFLRDVIGYDLAAFLDRNRKKLRSEIDAVLSVLLNAKDQ